MNLPNKLSILRIILLPFMMFFYLASFIPAGWGKLVALVIFIIAAFTDWLDGHIARKNNLVTDFGKFIDTIADKMLILITLVLLIADNTFVSPWGIIFLFIMCLRDYVVMGIKSESAAQGVALCAEQIGRIKFAVSTLAFPMGILVATLNAFAVSATCLLVFQIIFYVLMGATAVLTIYSGIYYIVKYGYLFKGKM